MRKEILTKNIPATVFLDAENISVEDAYVINRNKDAFNNNETIDEIFPDESDRAKFFETISRKAEAYLPDFVNRNPEAVERGQIWEISRVPFNDSGDLTFSFEKQYVYILAAPELFYEAFENTEIAEKFPEFSTVIALPISFETQYANQYDYLVGADNPVFGIPFMISTDAEFNVFTGDLRRKIYELEPEKSDDVKNLYYFTNQMERNPEVIKSIPKGKYSDKDYGEGFEYRRIIRENVRQFLQSIAFVSNQLTAENVLSEPQLAEIFELNTYQVYSPLAAGSAIAVDIEPLEKKVLFNSISYRLLLNFIKFEDAISLKLELFLLNPEPGKNFTLFVIDATTAEIKETLEFITGRDILLTKYLEQKLPVNTIFMLTSGSTTLGITSFNSKSNS